MQGRSGINETILANVRRWCEEWKRDQREQGRADNPNALARALLLLFRDDPRLDLRGRTQSAWYRRTVERLEQKHLRGGHPARKVFDADDLEAWGRLMGRPPVLLLDSGYEGPEASTEMTLFWGLDHELTHEEAASIVRRVHALRERDGLYDLAAQVLEALIRAETVAEANSSVYQLIKDSPVFKGPEDPRPSKTRRGKGKSAS